MTIKLIVAISENGAIGYKNNLLFKIPKDLKRFKELTQNNIVLFGRNTYESLPTKPLPNRINTVLTRKKNYNTHDHHIVVEHNLERIINYYKNTGHQDKDLWICGGEQIYRLALEMDCVEEIHLTKIHKHIEHYDTIFPIEYLDNFKLINQEKHYSDEYDCDYSFLTYVRNKIDRGE